jgi:hypothetical protein
VLSEDSSRLEFYAVSTGKIYVCFKGSYCLNLQDKTVEEQVVVLELVDTDIVFTTIIRYVPDYSSPEEREFQT